MEQSFYISQLRITGDGVRTAQLSFVNGLNYITGPSNTGKSYIFKCIDYIFGAKSLLQLANFKEYTHVWLELTMLGNRKVTLLRKMGERDVLLYATGIESIEDETKPTKVYRTGSSKDQKISDYIWSLLGLTDYPQLLSGKTKGTTETISLRDYLKFFFVDETRIIEDKVPLLSAQHRETQLVSLFRYILTGVDDGACIPIESPDIRKAKITGRIEMLQLILERQHDRSASLRERINEFEQADFSLSTGQYIAELEVFQQSVDSLTVQLAQKKQEYVSANQELSKEQVILSRLETLKQQYESDLERLQFTIDGALITQQVKTDVCPLCHTVGIGIAIGDQVTSEQLRTSYLAETTRINHLLSELDPVLATSRANVSRLLEKVVELENEVEAVIREVNEIRDTKITPIKDIVERFSELQKLKTAFIQSEKDIYDIQEEIKSEELKLQQKGEEQSYRQADCRDEMIAFSDILLSILRSWNVQCANVSLNADLRDFSIDGQHRIANGKGYRALYFSAFVYAIHAYLKEKNQLYFPCIMLDSPLTTWRGKEKHAESGEDEVDENIQHAMLRYIAQLDSVQSIILENKEIDNDVEQNANVIRFSGDIASGQYGLFPVDEN